MGIIGVLAITILIAMLEIPKLWKKRMKNDIWVYSILLLAGALLNGVIVLHLPMPNPLELLAWLYKPVSDFTMKLLS